MALRGALTAHRSPHQSPPRRDAESGSGLPPPTPRSASGRSPRVPLLAGARRGASYGLQVTNCCQAFHELGALLPVMRFRHCALRNQSKVHSSRIECEDACLPHAWSGHGLPQRQWA
ncbi:Protein of unknown function [Gryllus bimaculatus]|nr:Protein of unknown function [Gryllus bimaculatus]